MIVLQNVCCNSGGGRGAHVTVRVDYCQRTYEHAGRDVFVAISVSKQMASL